MAAHTAGDHITASSSAAPDKVEILLLAEAVTAWDLKGSDFPDLKDALVLVEEFTEYGRVVADDLRTLCLNIPTDSDVGLSTQSTLSEASRRLYLPPPCATKEAAAHRAQNLARLIQALNRATGDVRKEQAKTRSAAPRAPA